MFFFMLNISDIAVQMKTIISCTFFVAMSFAANFAASNQKQTSHEKIYFNGSTLPCSSSRCLG